MDKILSVLIVGCGNIAGRFDEKKKKQDLPYTHAGAFTQNEHFKLSACVEPNDQRKTEFMSFWQIEKGFSALEQVRPTRLYFDVISLCSPTEYHYTDLQIAIQLKPKLIFCEKPLANDLKKAESVVAKCEQMKILLAVNYTRSWDPYLQQLKAQIIAKVWGEIRSIVGTYNKGILNNGSHLIDLIFSLFGALNIIDVTQPVFDYLPDDPTVTALLETTEGVPVHLVTAHAEDYALFEIQFIFSKGVLTMEDGGFKWRERHVETSTVFNNYHSLAQGDIKQGGYEQAMSRAVDNIYQTIAQQKPMLKTGEMALNIQKLCEKIKQMSLLKIDYYNA